MNIIKNILIKLIYIILIPIIIYEVLLIAQSILNPEITPNIFGVKTFSIVSSSMSPTIGKNDIVIVKECEENEIQINDIITFNVDGETITHRVINIKQEENGKVYITKGDSNEIADTEKISFKQIEGKYVGRIPKARQSIRFSKK